MKEKHLSHRFRVIKSQNPNLGNYLILSMAVRGMNYNKWLVYKALDKYVPKSDYAKEEREALMENLVVSTNAPHAETYGLTEPDEKVRLAQVNN